MRTPRILFGLLFFVIVGCETFDPVELPPSFIEVNEYDLITTVDQGGTADRIEDVWVTVNQEFIGVFPIPAKVPINLDGPSEVSIAPGIRINGISSARVRHPFLYNHNRTMDLFRDSVLEIRPQFGFSATADFAWVEDFEEVGMTLEASLGSPEVMRTDDPAIAFSGKCAHLRLEPDQQKFECVSDRTFDLPGSGNPVILEFSFMGNNTLIVGAFIENAAPGYSPDIVTLLPTQNWKRVYVNLTQAVSFNSNNTGVRPFFGFLRNTDITGNANVYIDNIKLIY